MKGDVINTHDMHNRWNVKDQFSNLTEVVFNISVENVSITVDNKIVFSQSGGVKDSEARLIKFTAEGLAKRFNTSLIVNEVKQVLN